MGVSSVLMLVLVWNVIRILIWMVMALVSDALLSRIVYIVIVHHTVWSVGLDIGRMLVSVLSANHQ